MNFRHPGVRVVIAALVILGAVILYRSDPTAGSWHPKCMLHQWTGLHCVGCGTTRALRAVLHGDIVAAIRFNPLLVIGAPVFAVLIWHRNRRERRGVMVSPAFAITIFIILVGYSIARNIPTPTTSPLAPWVPEVVEKFSQPAGPG